MCVCHVIYMSVMSYIRLPCIRLSCHIYAIEDMLASFGLKASREKKQLGMCALYQ